MKIAIVGSRNIPDEEKAYRLIKENIPKECTEIVSGGAKGIDTLAERYAKEMGLIFTIFQPEYKKYGRRAALLRNTQIVEYADEVYAFWDMNSNGTLDTLIKCRDSKKSYKIIRI